MLVSRLLSFTLQLARISEGDSPNRHTLPTEPKHRGFLERQQQRRKIMRGEERTMFQLCSTWVRIASFQRLERLVFSISSCFQYAGIFRLPRLHQTGLFLSKSVGVFFVCLALAVDFNGVPLDDVFRSMCLASRRPGIESLGKLPGDRL